MDEFEALAETVEGTVLRCDGRGSITYAAPSARAATGYSVDELLGMDVSDLVASEGGTELIESLRRERGSGAPVGRADAVGVVAIDGVHRAVEELVENAVEHNDQPEASVEVSVTAREERLLLEERSKGTIRFSEREPRGSVVTVVLRAADDRP